MNMRFQNPKIHEYFLIPISKIFTFHIIESPPLGDDFNFGSSNPALLFKTIPAGEIRATAISVNVKTIIRSVILKIAMVGINFNIEIENFHTL